MLDSTRFRSIGVIAAAGLVLILAVPVTGWRLHTPRLGVSFAVDRNGDFARITEVLADGTAEAIGVKVGDRLVAIGSVRIPRRQDLRALYDSYGDVISRYRAGDRVSWVIIRDGERRVLDSVLRSAPRDWLASQLTVFGLFWACAFFLWWARGEIKAVRALVYAVLAVTTGQYFRFAADMPLDTAAAVAINQVSIVSRFLGPPLVVHFGLVFPMDWRRPRTKRLILGLAYGVAFVLLLGAEARSLRAMLDPSVPYAYDFELLQRLHYFDLRFWVFVGGFVTCGILLLHTYRHLREVAVRRRIKWVVWGVMLAAGIDALAMAIIYSRFQGYPLATVESYRNFLYLSIAAGIVVSVFRDDLFDVDLVLRKTAVMLATAGGLFLVFAVAEQVFSTALQEVVPAAGTIGSIAAGVLAAALLAPLRNWIDARVKKVLPAATAGKPE